jgi:hypothetical protein
MMSRSAALRIVIGALMICCGSAHGSVIDPEYDPIKDYSDLRPGRVVVVGVVESVQNVEIGTTGTYPEITLAVEATYVGEQRTIMTVIGFNTCYVQNNEWLISQIGDAPWLVPGDRVLIMAQEVPAENTGRTSACLRLRSAFYILDHNTLSSNALYTYRGVPGVKNAALSSVSSSLVDVLRAMPREPAPTGYSLDDFVSAINKKQEAR